MHRREYDVHVILADTYSCPYLTHITERDTFKRIYGNNGNISTFDNATSVRYRTRRSKQNEKQKRYVKFLQNVVGDILYRGYYHESPDVLFIASILFGLDPRDRSSRDKKYRALRLKGHSAVMSKTSCAESRFGHVYI